MPSAPIVARCGEHTVVLYATGRRHAGENLHTVLSRRPAGLPPPTQMCDALARNLPGDLETDLANCLAHSRRYYVDVAPSFPEEVRHVLEELALVYQNDRRARQDGMTAAERLAHHQERSLPVMERLHTWMRAQTDGHLVEPNSGLGEAIAYMKKHWEKLTLFLRKAGAPLDNTICERFLKTAILHRKNSLFYRTQHGAHVGDVYMSLIATAKAAHVDPFHYLTAVLEHADVMARAPLEWMPWNYREALTRAGPPTGVP